MNGKVCKRLRKAAREQWKTIPIEGIRVRDGVRILYDAGKRVYRKAKEKRG